MSLKTKIMKKTIFIRGFAKTLSYAKKQVKVSEVYAMSRAVLLIMLALFGIFVYYNAFKGIIIYPLLIAIVILVGIWYVMTFLVTRKMVDKQRRGESFLFLRGQLVDKIRNEVVYGALVVTRTELVFYKRKNWNGGIQAVWSSFTPALESYEIERVDGKHKGLKLSVKGEIHPIYIATKSIEKEEKAFRAIIGWPEE